MSAVGQPLWIYYRVPTHQDKALGDIFKHYQPEHEQGL